MRQKMIAAALAGMMAITLAATPAYAHAAYTYNANTGEEFGVSLLENAAVHNDGVIKSCDRAADGHPLVAIAYNKTAYGWKVIGKVQDSYGGSCDSKLLNANADGHRAGLRYPDGSIRHLGSMSTGGH